MQKIIMSLVLTGLLTSVSGCNKNSDNRAEHEKYLTENGVCYIKVTKKDDIAKFGKTMPTIYTLILKEPNHKSKEKQEKFHTLFKGIIDQGCDVNENRYGRTPLMNVLLGNQRELLTLLIENGADPMITNHSTHPKTKGKNFFEISALLRSKDTSPDRAKTDDLVQSYKVQFEK